VGDKLYVFARDAAGEAAMCLDAASGKTLWTSALGGKGFGSIVDAGAALLALTPEGELAVFEPSDKAFNKRAGYKVGEATYACPVPVGNNVYIKDKDSLACWAVE
jgi:outer membrane protein assembly factor BamB